MSAKYLGPEVMNLGLNRLYTNCDRIMVISQFSLGAVSYAEVTDDDLGYTAINTSSDIVLSDNGSGRRATIPAKTVTATGTASGNPDLHIALLDTVNSDVLAVLEETSKQPITSGNDINIPSATIDINQPA